MFSMFYLLIFPHMIIIMKHVKQTLKSYLLGSRRLTVTHLLCLSKSPPVK